MADVIALADHKPHIGGDAVCVHCGHTWQAVSPVGMFDELECSECGLMKGVMKYGVVPESYWQCGCGCHLFTVSGITKDMLCWQCGAVQEFGT